MPISGLVGGKRREKNLSSRLSTATVYYFIFCISVGVFGVAFIYLYIEEANQKKEHTYIHYICRRLHSLKHTGLSIVYKRTTKKIYRLSQ